MASASHIWDKVGLYCRPIRKVIFVLVVPLLLSPILIDVNNQIGDMAFIIALMGAYWMTEVLPLSVTALLPVLLYPIFGIRSAKEVAPLYFPHNNFMLFGGLVLAIAIEHQNLHRRFALRVLLFVGTNPRRLILGFMAATAFLSMWISNTATTAMMLPIARAVVDEIGQQTDDDEAESQTTDDQDSISLQEKKKPESLTLIDQANSNDKVVVEIPSKEDNETSSSHLRFCKGILLCIPYAANVGGTGSLTGTGSNIVCAGMVEKRYGSAPGLNFGTWLLLNFPLVCMCTIMNWAWLQWFYVSDRCQRSKHKSSKSTEGDKIKRIISKAYESLGPIRFAEWAVLGHFVVLILLWIFLNPKFIPGWASLFTPGYVKGSTPAIFIALLLFVFPSDIPRKIKRGRLDPLSSRSPDSGTKGNVEDGNVADCTSDRIHPSPKAGASIPPLVNWQVVQQKMPWNVFLIIGGGYALADGCVQSGLSSWVAAKFVVFQGVPPVAMVFIVCCMLSVLTEFTSNVVMVSIFLPILAEISEAMHINPLYLILPATNAAAFAFMMPVATVPNAIAFANKEIRVIDMVKTGCVLNLLCVSVLTFNINTLGRLIFKFNIYPSWASDNFDGIINSTVVSDVNSTWIS